MHAAVKVLIGFVLFLIGLALFVDALYPILGTSNYFPGDWLTNFIVVLTGVIPIFLIILGLFIVWLETDELKTQKEIREEEKKSKKKK